MNLLDILGFFNLLLTHGEVLVLLLANWLVRQSLLLVGIGVAELESSYLVVALESDDSKEKCNCKTFHFYKLYNKEFIIFI